MGQPADPREGRRIMIVIDDIIISDLVKEEVFACDVTACKGACCLLGDLGAALEVHELDILEKDYGAIREYLSPPGVITIEENGKGVKDSKGATRTPLMSNGACAYVDLDDGIARCGIERAYEAGRTDFRKPISCHLYPIRIHTYPGLKALNYHRWDICLPARELGAQRGILVYQFVKNALVRKYGWAFYWTLHASNQPPWHHAGPFQAR